MNTQLLSNSMKRIALLLPKICKIETNQLTMNRKYSLFKSIMPLTSTTSLSKHVETSSGKNLLEPIQPIFNQVCGIKLRKKLHLRCRDCFFYKVNGRLMVGCKTHPRHKVAKIVREEHNTWILSSVSQGKLRPW